MKTIREETFGKTTVRLLRAGDGGYVGVTLSNGRASAPLYGDDADELWGRLRRGVGPASPAYFGHDGARARFLKMFPGGFASPGYFDQERKYKLAAKKRLEDALPFEAAPSATTADAKAVMGAFTATNMLSQFELMRMKDILTSDRGPDFVRGAAAFAGGAVRSGIAAMEAAASRVVPRLSWTMATYLPFLWDPARHMYLKPEVTRDFAERVGHAFAFVYDPKPSAEVYEALLDLVHEVEAEIADLEPADRIDVQSYIWVVGRYEDADAPQAETA